MAITLLLLWVFLYDYAEGKELPKEMSMATEAGEIVLTSEECAFKKQAYKVMTTLLMQLTKVILTMKVVGSLTPMKVNTQFIFTFQK